MKRVIQLVVFALSATLSLSAQKYVPKVEPNGFKWYKIEDNNRLDIGLADAYGNLVMRVPARCSVEVLTFSELSEPYIKLCNFHEHIEAVYRWDGSVVIPFEKAINSITAVEVDGRCFFKTRNKELRMEGIYDLQGNEIIAIGRYDSVRPEKYGTDVYFDVSVSGHYAMVDYNGREFIPLQRDRIYLSDDGDFFCYGDGNERKILCHGVPSHMTEIDAYFKRQEEAARAAFASASVKESSMSSSRQGRPTKSSYDDMPKLKPGTYKVDLYHDMANGYLGGNSTMTVTNSKVTVDYLDVSWSVLIDIDDPMYNEGDEELGIVEGLVYAKDFKSAMVAIGREDGDTVVYLFGKERVIANYAIHDQDAIILLKLKMLH